MSRNTRKTNPIIAGFIAFILSPIVGMLWLNKGKWAIGYVLLPILFLVTLLVLNNFDILNLELEYAYNIFSYIYITIGLIHCIIIARNTKEIQMQRWYARWGNIAMIIFVPIFAALCFRSLAYAPYHIPSGSMRPTLLVGDYIFTEKFTYGYNKYSFPFNLPLIENKGKNKLPQRGDIVIFKVNIKDKNIDFVKRIIGLPNDSIQIIDGNLYINDKKVQRRKIEDYIYTNSKGKDYILSQYIEISPEGKEYLILDKKEESEWDNTKIYNVPEGHYFVMGDNRDNSDSRQGLVRYVPLENIVGKASVIVWS